MANTFTLKSNSYDGRYLELTCTQTQNVAANTSTISWTLTSKGGSVSKYSTGATTVTINGTQVYYKERVSYNSGVFPATTGSTSGTLTVSHNNDGSKSIAVSLSTAIYYADIKTTSGTWALDKVPRAAQISSITAFTDENTPTIKYTNYVGTAASAVKVFIYADDDKTLLVGAKSLSVSGTSATYTLTAAERNTLLKAAKNTNSLPVRFYLETTISGSTYWSEPYAINMSVVNANPTASIEFRDSNETANNITGNNQIFMLGVSDFKYTITPTAKKEATITKCAVYLGSKSALGASSLIEDIDSSAFTYVVTDSRGNEYKETINLNVVPYIPITCSQEAHIELEGETGAKIICDITGNYYDGTIGATQNYINLYFRVAEGSGEFGEWEYIGTAQTIADGVYTCEHIFTEYGGNTLNYEKSYTVQIAAQDAYDTVNSGSKTVRLTPVFDWSETDFNFNVPLKYKGNNMPVITAQGSKDGWYYRNWSNGMGEAWKILTHTTAINNAWGSLYYGTDTSRQTYPFPFKSKPVEQVNLLCGGKSAWVIGESSGVNGGVQSGVYSIIRPVAETASQTFYLSMYVYGELK